MTDYTIVSRFRNKEKVQYLIDKIHEKGYSCYNFLEMPADPKNPNNHPEKQMQVFEATENFMGDEYISRIFKRDLNGLKNANIVLLLLPAGIAAHIELGIAYGLGKKCIMIGEPEKPESLYHLFNDEGNEQYNNIEEFLESI